MVSSVAVCCVQPSYGARPTMHCQWGWLCSFFCFLSLVTLTFELGRDFCIMYLTAKFDRPTFSHSKFIVRTNILTNKLTQWQTNRCHWKHPPCFATLCRWVKCSATTKRPCNMLCQLTSCQLVHRYMKNCTLKSLMGIGNSMILSAISLPYSGL